MRDFVVAMAHAGIAQTNRQKQFAVDLRGPEFYVRRFLIASPGVIATFLNSEFDDAFQIGAAELMLAHLSGDDSEAQPTSGPGCGLEGDSRAERVFYERRFA